MKPGWFTVNKFGNMPFGGISNILKKRGWCSNVSAYHRELKTSGKFCVSCSLSSNDVNFIDDVISIIYEYVKTLRFGAMRLQYYDEEIQISRNSFHFEESDELYQFVRVYPECMLYLSPEQ